MSLDDIVKASQLVTPMGVAFASWIAWRGVKVSEANQKALKEVHLTTNSLALRNESIARKLGVAEGTAAGIEQGKAEAQENTK